jgi:hypothetical protein
MSIYAYSKTFIYLVFDFELKFFITKLFEKEVVYAMPVCRSAWRYF